ncbi:hypothetical protein [uncultured Butyricimonas sp.]|uniref:hypothetical protein n=1 Tax=uncultured Butyricimonas sp. TaxID=1268785 RepID=UPI0026DCAFAA|nr:hypothetical protein [uncultured Butyricimonas sp.]
MAKALAKTRKRYTPLDLAYSRSVSGALNQTYDANYQTYDPDRGLVPLEILFTVRATDPKGVIAPGIINSKLTDIRWYENVVDDAHNILDSNTAYIIDRNGTTDSRGKLTARKNTPLDGVVLIFTAKYTDPRNGKVVNVTASITLGVTISTEEPLRVKPGYPFGQVVDPTERRDIIEIDNPLFVGDREYEGSIFRWQKKVGSNYTTIAEGESGITGTFSGKLKVPCPAVGKRMDIRCIADALPDLTGVNLISKAMISDDWNAISAGISTPGEDADGEYLKINESLLYNTFRENGVPKDVFSGKIKYKTNQRYRLSVQWKCLGLSSAESNGLYFIINYSDGSSINLILPKSQTTKAVYSVVTPPGKTITKITTTFGSYQGSLIYDLQLVEYNGASNLVTGGAFKRVPASGIATGNSFGTFYISPEIAAQLTVGTKVTLSIEEVKVLAGNLSSLSFNIIDGVNLSTGVALPLSTLKATRVIIDNPNATARPHINIYAGVFNSVVGNAVELRGVMLVIGETAYKYSPADDEFIPALADGAPRPENPSERAITTDHVLSTQYPKCDIEVVAPAEILDETSLFGASVVMHSNRGDIVKPELYWGFPWKDKTGAVFARGSKLFIKEEQFDNEEFDYSVEAIEGLEEAKWAANFNGIDQYLGNNNSISLYPWGYGSTRTHVVEFILDALRDGNMQQVVYLCHQTSGGVAYGFSLAITTDGRMQFRVGREAGATPSPTVYYGTTVVQPGKLYRVEVAIAVDGTYSATVNGVPEEFKGVGGAIYSSSLLRIGFGTTGSYFNGKVLRYEVFNADKSVYHLWDFQPTNGDRANMLKNKNAYGVVSGTLNLIPYNIPGIDDVDPENGFFVTI